MSKSYFHNNKSFFKQNEHKTTTQISLEKKKNVVDINILLNRVKLEEKNERNRKIIFFSFSTFAIGLFGTFIAIIK